MTLVWQTKCMGSRHAKPFDRTKIDMGVLLFSNSGHTTGGKFLFFMIGWMSTNLLIGTGSSFVIIVTEMAVGKIEL